MDERLVSLKFVNDKNHVMGLILILKISQFYKHSIQWAQTHQYSDLIKSQVLSLEYYILHVLSKKRGILIKVMKDWSKSTFDSINGRNNIFFIKQKDSTMRLTQYSSWNSWSLDGCLRKLEHGCSVIHHLDAESKPGIYHLPP